MVTLPQLTTLVTLLRSPGRKRTTTLYHYRVIHQNPDPHAAGCVILWEVSGGRSVYQLALERTEAGVLRVQCTCADAVFRAEDQGRFCKHVQGLIQFARPTYPCPDIRAD
jgi:hypothetical protein